MKSLNEIEGDVLALLNGSNSPLDFADIWFEVTEDDNDADVHLALERLFREGKVDKIAHIRPTSDGVNLSIYWVAKKNATRVKDWEFKKV